MFDYVDDLTSLETRAEALVLGLYDALATGDADAIRSRLTGDFIGKLAAGLPFGIGGEHAGPDAMIADGWFAIGRHWRIRPYPEKFSVTPSGHVIVEGSYRGRARQSAGEFEAAYVHDFSLEGDRFSRLVQTTDTAAFRGALGDRAPLEAIAYTVERGVATIELNRPRTRNAINQAMADELLVVARRIERDPSVRAVLICGAGPDLTVGGDISFFAEQGLEDLPSLLRSMTTPFHAGFDLLSRLNVPIVTAAQGAVAGGGIGFAYAADILLVADDCRFVTAFGHIGLSGDGGGTWHLPRRIGPARAAAAYLLGDPITAQQAYDWGLAAEIVPAADLADRARQVADRLANGPTRAYAEMRRLLRESWQNSLGTQLLAETDALQECASTTDARAAIQAFIDKQTPTFEGA